MFSKAYSNLCNHLFESLVSMPLHTAIPFLPLLILASVFISQCLSFRYLFDLLFLTFFVLCEHSWGGFGQRAKYKTNLPADEEDCCLHSHTSCQIPQAFISLSTIDLQKAAFHY